MDINVILFTVMIFAAMLFFLRFLTALVYPAFFIIIAILLFNYLKRYLSRRADGEAPGPPEYREQGLSLKYSGRIVDMRNIIACVKSSALGDKDACALLEPVYKMFDDHFNMLFELFGAASKTEMSMKSVNIAELKERLNECAYKRRNETDKKLAAGYDKNMALFLQLIGNYEYCERSLRLIDVEADRIKAYYENFNMRLASVFMAKKKLKSADIDEFRAEMKKNFADIAALKRNIDESEK